MGVTRKQLAFEGKFVQIPNEWVRDARLSRRARGLLAEIMSHRIGWHISISSLQSAGIEGRDAIRSALAELREAGYLTRSQTRGDAGRFNEVEYDLSEPVTADGKPVSGGFTGSGSPVSGLPANGESDTKNTIPLEDDFSEDNSSSPAVAASRPDVVHLCELLQNLIVGNGSKRPNVGKTWFDAGRLMLDADHRDPASAERLMRWTQADPFWRGNIMSMPTFRAKYDQLRLAANRQLEEKEKAVKLHTPKPGRSVADINAHREEMLRA